MPPPAALHAVAALHLLLALVAAALSALLCAPSLRFVRSYWLQQSPPEWAADHVVARPLPTALLHLHLVMPLVCSLLWVSD